MNALKRDEKDFICKDSDGNLFISLDKIDEQALADDKLLTHCLAVVKIGNDYLLGWNKWRNRYEIFGGCTENGETPRECIARECFEELGIENGDFRYIGAMRFYMMPDWFSEKERIELGGLYGISLNDMSIEDISYRIKDKEEIVRLALYSQIKNKEPIAIIDEKLLEYF